MLASEFVPLICRVSLSNLDFEDPSLNDVNQTSLFTDTFEDDLSLTPTQPGVDPQRTQHRSFGVSHAPAAPAPTTSRTKSLRYARSRLSLPVRRSVLSA